MVREIVLYLPVGGHPATADIARGSAVVGQPEPGADEVHIYFEGAIFGQLGMRTLADRARHACGRMLERYPTIAMRVVPRDALVVVGTFDPREGRIMLTGSHSERAVAAWLGVPQLNPSELRHGARGAVRGVDVASVRDVTVTVNRSLGAALIERGGIRRDAGSGVWVDAEGRRTSAIAEALVWALVAIAERD